MTEQEWLTSTDPQAMLTFLANSVRGVTYDNPTIEAGVPLISPRKLRLFACACARQVWDGETCPRCGGNKEIREPRYAQGNLHEYRQCPQCHGTGRVGGLTDPRSRNAVEIAEKYADGEATFAEMSAAHDGARWAQDDAGREWPEVTAMVTCGTDAASVAVAMTLPGRDIAPATQATLLRCICGNPWRPVALQTYEATPSRVESGVLGAHRVCPAAAGRWVDSPFLAGDGAAVPQMARQIYADRDWAALPVLADALEDAGCTDAAIMAHLRDGGVHARGCWVVDLILGKK